MADISSFKLSSNYPNLANERLGLVIGAKSDEFFAPATRLFAPEDPVFIPDKFDDNGKWMDGWETRRRRAVEPDHDWLEFSLGAPALIHALNLSTKHFTGNFPPYASLEARIGDDAENPDYKTLIPKSDLEGDSDNWFEVPEHGPWQHFRIKIYPDGGLARLRMLGDFVCNLVDDQQADLASLLSGAKVIGFSDAHFGQPNNMLMPDKALNMGDGWETARRRGPGFDWSLIKLGCPGIVQQITISTRFFKGNYPDLCKVRGANISSEVPVSELIEQAPKWDVIVGKQKLEANQDHVLNIDNTNTFSHLLLNMYPDGGISRLRVDGIAKP